MFIRTFILLINYVVKKLQFCLISKAMFMLAILDLAIAVEQLDLVANRANLSQTNSPQEQVSFETKSRFHLGKPFQISFFFFAHSWPAFSLRSVAWPAPGVLHCESVNDSSVSVNMV